MKYNPPKNTLKVTNNIIKKSYRTINPKDILPKNYKPSSINNLPGQTIPDSIKTSKTKSFFSAVFSFAKQLAKTGSSFLNGPVTGVMINKNLVDKNPFDRKKGTADCEVL